LQHSSNAIICERRKSLTKHALRTEVDDRLILNVFLKGKGRRRVMVFANRREAGKILAARLLKYAEKPDVLILALPRGGMPVAYEVAQILKVPLDIFFVRKLGLPECEELSLGSITSEGDKVLNEEIVLRLGISKEEIELLVDREQKELETRETLFRRGNSAPDVTGQTVILIDDGLATGCSMRAAVKALRHRQPARIVVAVPAAARSACDELASEADELVCLTVPESFTGISSCYKHFLKTSDEEDRDLLASASQPKTKRAAQGDPRS
jgi:putative phosphoribosyl transferase